ncbi:MAG: MerR family transcriptional regulator [Anaerolineae bacterium]|nr:MerR family transcriptional regulator [Anaerolineae bacterium]
MAQDHLYSSRHVATIFGVALETVRNWADEFERHLSPTATPGKGKHRMYSSDDLRVFALIAEQKKQGMVYDDIHGSLDNGQRGNPPPMYPDEVQALVIGEKEQRLSIEVEYLQRSMIQLQRQLDEARSELKAAEAAKEEKIRLEVKLESEQQRTNEREQRIAELKADLDKAHQRVEELLREIGHSYAKGVVEGMKSRGELNNHRSD